MGAVIPDTISKLRPSKVMSSGTALFINNQNKTSSTGIRTTCKRVNVLVFKPSIYFLPLAVAKSKIINNKGGATISKNRGGIVSVTV